MNSELGATRPGRPAAFDRAEVLDRLMTLFWQDGYDRVSQQQMAAATGLSTSSLYHSFGTKIEMFREAMAGYLGRMRFVLEPLERGEGGAEDVLEMVARLETVLRGPNAGFGCMATTAMMTPIDEEIARSTSGYRDQLRSGFVAVAERARALGEAAPDPAVTANLMTAAVLGTLTIARADKTGRELPAQLDALRAFVRTWIVTAA